MLKAEFRLFAGIDLYAGIPIPCPSMSLTHAVRTAMAAHYAAIDATPRPLPYAAVNVHFRFAFGAQSSVVAA